MLQNNLKWYQLRKKDHTVMQTVGAVPSVDCDQQDASFNKLTS